MPIKSYREIIAEGLPTKLVFTIDGGNPQTLSVSVLPKAVLCGNGQCFDGIQIVDPECVLKDFEKEVIEYAFHEGSETEGELPYEEQLNDEFDRNHGMFIRKIKYKFE